jgi:hypothetical protein
MEQMTAEQRHELSWVKNAKIIRQGVYEVGILLGAILLAGQADIVAKVWPWPEFPMREIIFGLAVIWWVEMIFHRATEWKSIAGLEKALDRDELEREIGRELEKDEAKNLGA